MYYRSRAIKTKDARAWEEQILSLLQEHTALLDMAEIWRKSGGIFQIAICDIYPEHKFYNKQGQISSKTFDCDNILKPLIDLIFGKYMNINDKHITKVTGVKAIGASKYLSIFVELLPVQQS